MSCAVSSVLWTRGNIYEPKPNPVCFLVSPLYLDPDSIASIHEALDTVEESDAIGLVTTGTGKFFSNGLDLSYLLNLVQQDHAGFIKFMEQFGKFVGRFLTFPMPTVAAMNGKRCKGMYKVQFMWGEIDGRGCEGSLTLLALPGNCIPGLKSESLEMTSF